MLTRLFILLIFKATTHESPGGTTSLVSILFGYLLTVPVLIPVFLLLRDYPGMDLYQVARQLSPRLGKLAAAGFYLVCLLAVVETAAQFSIFLTSAVYPRASSLWLVLIFCGAVLYLVFLGLEAVTRTAAILLVAVCASGVLLGLGLWKFWDVLNLYSPFTRAFCRPVLYRAVRYPESGAGRAGAAGVESQHRPNPQYLLGVSQPLQSDDLAHGICCRGNSGQRRRDEELSGLHHVCPVRLECVLSIRLYSDYALGRHQHDSCGDVSAAGISDAQRADRQTLWMVDTGTQRGACGGSGGRGGRRYSATAFAVSLTGKRSAGVSSGGAAATVLLAIRWKGKRKPKEGRA